MPITSSRHLRRALPLGCALAACALGLAAAPAGAASAPASPTLPAPSGRPVGTVTLHLTDHGRRDPWTGEGPREIALSAFYPARRESRAPAPYLAPALADGFASVIGVAPDPLRALRTHAGEGAAARKGRRPVVIVAPGAGTPRSSMTVLAEDLAAHGYVALAVDHPGDAAMTQLGDGRLRPLDPGFLAGMADFSSIPTALRARRDDIRFLLDRLPALGRRGPLRGLLDPRRVAMAGHSLGGAAAAEVMLADRRLDAGVNYDGMFFGAAARRSVDRPFMTMTGRTDPTLRPFLARQRGPGLLVTLAGAGHQSFTDYAFIAPLLSPSAMPMDLGRLAPAAVVRAQLAYTRAFLARHLRDRPADALLTRRRAGRHPAATVEFARSGGAA
jgi:predicted dienelactone hydrolase